MTACVERYIDASKHGEEEFSAEQQARYVCTRGAEQGSDFARGVKRRSWRTAVRFKEDLDAFMKPIHDHNAWHRQLKATYPGLEKFPVKRIRGKGERADWYYNLKKTEFGDKGVYKWPNIYDQFPLLYSSSNSLQSKL